MVREYIWPGGDVEQRAIILNARDRKKLVGNITERRFCDWKI